MSWLDECEPEPASDGSALQELRRLAFASGTPDSVRVTALRALLDRQGGDNVTSADMEVSVDVRSLTGDALEEALEPYFAPMWAMLPRERLPAPKVHVPGMELSPSVQAAADQYAEEEAERRFQAWITGGVQRAEEHAQSPPEEPEERARHEPEPTPAEQDPVAPVPLEDVAVFPDDREAFVRRLEREQRGENPFS